MSSRLRLLPLTPLVPLLLFAAPAPARWEDAVPFTVDTQAPSEPVITSPAPGATLTLQRPSYSGTAEPDVTVIVSVDGKVIARVVADALGNWFFIPPDPLEDGSHTVGATAQDAAGNVSTATHVPFTITANPPDTRITAMPPLKDLSTTATFQFDAPGRVDIGSYDCSLDGRNFVSCYSPKAYAYLTEGTHTFAVRARTYGGVVDPTPGTYTWTIGADTDNDDIIDSVEMATGTNPYDGDSDDDGILDGNEDKNHNGIVDEGETDPRKADTDGDGLQDGTEQGLTAPQDTSTGSGFIPDADPTTTTNPLEEDTDHGGDSDGTEDGNHNGLLDPGETDPNKAADDTPFRMDSDGDGLSDGDESSRGTDPRDHDTDDDGLMDGKEVTRYRTHPLEKDTDGDGLLDGSEVAHGLDPNDEDTDDDGVRDGADGLVDTDGDGLLDALDADSDGDGLADGTELGVTRATAPAGTNTDSPHFVPDEDPPTSTPPKKADTDDDGLADGEEDTNHDGRLGPGETDPTGEDTDHGGVKDGDEVKRGGNPLDAKDDLPPSEPGCGASGSAPRMWLAVLLLALARRPRGSR